MGGAPCHVPARWVHSSEIPLAGGGGLGHPPGGARARAGMSMATDWQGKGSPAAWNSFSETADKGAATLSSPSGLPTADRRTDGQGAAASLGLQGRAGRVMSPAVADRCSDTGSCYLSTQSLWSIQSWPVGLAWCLLNPRPYARDKAGLPLPPNLTVEWGRTLFCAFYRLGMSLKALTVWFHGL